MKADSTNKSVGLRFWQVLMQAPTIGLLVALAAVGLTAKWFKGPSIPWTAMVGHIEENRNASFYLKILDADKNTPLAGASIRGCGSTDVLTDGFGVGRLKLGAKHYPCDLEVISDGYGATWLHLQAPRSDPNMTVILSPISHPDPYVEIVRSGPRPSGFGGEFSPWYELRSPQPKPGYVIDVDKTQYSLSGDRRCNEWSECQLRRESPESVVFSFRMQGHSEWFPPRQAISEGVLRVQYKPSDQSGIR
jgi:hypothetical protein